MHPAKETSPTLAREVRLRRNRMRSWRRGMKEMDLILGPYADQQLAGLTDQALSEYEALLAENDQSLYLWVTAASTGRPHGAPVQVAPALDRVAAWLAGRPRP